MIAVLLHLIVSGFTWSAVAEGEGNVVSMQVDGLGQIYTLDEEELKKFSPEGELLFAASFNASGTPTALDVSNPMKPFLFYEGTGNLLLLDNTLSPQHSAFDLYAETQRTVEAVCGSFNNHFWLFDAEQTEVIRVDVQLRQTDGSGPLFGVIPELTHVDQMREFGNHLYVLQKGRGIFVFDQFATYLYTLPLKEATVFGFWGEQLVYSDGERLAIHQRYSPADISVEIPVGAGFILGADAYRCMTRLENKWTILKAEPVD